MNKLFWKIYWRDKSRFCIMAIFLILFSALVIMFTKINPLLFIIGFVIADPVSYYIVSYRKILRAEKEKKAWSKDELSKVEKFFSNENK